MFDKIYFSSGGFYALYNHLGAIRELHTEYNKPDSKLARKITYYGVSAGTPISILCYLVLENLITIDKLFEIVNSMDSFNIVGLNITSLAFVIIDKLFDNCPPDLHERISNVIYMGVTTKNGYKQISQYATNADVYNTILCSCSIAGLFNYDSKIDGETCIDGVYSFKYEYIPPDTMIINLSVFSSPLSLTIPPLALRPLLNEMGKQTVIDYMNGKNPATNDDGDNIKKLRARDILDVNGWLLINQLTYKNPMWKSHIESKTKSKISDNVSAKLNIGLFDLVNYVHNSILNHRH